MSRYNSIEEFKKEYIETFNRRANLNAEQISVLENLIDEKLNVQNITIYNSHSCEETEFTPLDFINTVYDDKLIMIESGVLFRDTDVLEDLPPSIEVEEYLGNDRDEKKSLMKYYDDPARGNDPVKARYYKAQQLDDKVKMNTFYGLFIMGTSHLFNPDLAASITCRGRSLISVCALAVESVVAGYFTKSPDSVLYFIDRVSEETYLDDVLEHLDYNADDVMSNMKILPTQPHYNLIRNLVLSKPKRTINRLAIKNNIQRFLEIDSVADTINKIITISDKNNKPFVNPYDKRGIEEHVNTLQNLVTILYGFYWYRGDGKTAINTQELIKEIPREAIALIDTDSNMVAQSNISSRIDHMYGNLFETLDGPDKEFTVKNISTIIIDYAIDYSLQIYKTHIQIPDKYRDMILMKNEYNYLNLCLTSRKKNYAGIVAVKEGVVYKKPKLDVKGLMFTKSSVNSKIGDLVSDIIENHILRVDRIHIPSVVKVMRDTSEELKKEIKSEEGTALYLSQKLNNKLVETLPTDARTKGIELYNFLGLGDRIVPPARFLTLSVDWENPIIAKKYGEYYQKAVLYGLVHGLHASCYKLTNELTYDKIDKKKTRLISDNVPNIIRILTKKYREVFDAFCDRFVEGSQFLNVYKNGSESKKEITRDMISQDILDRHKGNISEAIARVKVMSSWLSGEFKRLNAMRRDLDSDEKYSSISKITNLTMKKTGPGDLRLSIDESITENIPQFILDLIDDTPYTTQIDNLSAPIVESTKLLVVRNDDGKNNILNTIDYY